MNRKIPLNAFEHYYGLGPGRSYQAVADHYGVTKRAVTAFAKREGWSDRLDRIENNVRKRSDKRLEETLEQMNERHLRLLKAVQGKALEALRTMPIGSAMDAARAIDMTIKQERLIRGEPTDRAAVCVEDTIRREYERWLVVDGAGSSGAEDDVDVNEADALPDSQENAAWLEGA